MNTISKSDFIRRALTAALVLLTAPAASFAEEQPFGSADEAWDNLHLILDQIQAPTFPDRDFLITAFGAVGDGETLNTEAIRDAIAACAAAGGGRVVVPSGVFLTGAVHLKSNVNLHLAEEDSILKFSRNPQDYLPVVFTRWEGVELYNYSPFVYAFEQENIAITGNGTLDGNADSEHWWPWKGRWTRRSWEIGPDIEEDARRRLIRMGESGVPVERRVFGEGHFLRPKFVQFYRCKNILLDGITIIDSPMWVIHPVLSENITIANVTVRSHGPNSDGCNPESSRNVLIRDSYFDTGDDCIAIKSGRGADGRRVNVPSENIVVQRTTMRDGHGAVVLGSEISGSVRNVFVEDCKMDSPRLQRILRVKTNSNRGGVLENFFVRNLKVGNVRMAILHIDFNYEGGDFGRFTPVVRNIFIDNVTSEQSDRVMYIHAYERSPVSNVHITNSTFNGVRREDQINFAEDILVQNSFVNGEPMVSPTE